MHVGIGFIVCWKPWELVYRLLIQHFDVRDFPNDVLTWNVLQKSICFENSFYCILGLIFVVFFGSLAGWLAGWLGGGCRLGGWVVGVGWVAGWLGGWASAGWSVGTRSDGGSPGCIT